MNGTIEYKGVEYRKVKRKADVGDLITYNYNGSFTNSPRRVLAIGINGVEFEPYVDNETTDEETIGYTHDAYDVLEPIKDESPRTESALIANLALRVSKLEHALEPKSYADIEPDEQTEVGADNVNHPSHYTQGGVEVIDIIAQITRGYTDGFHAYCVGNALKYLARAPYKHAEIDEDVRKAAKYIEFIIDDKGAI